VRTPNIFTTIAAAALTSVAITFAANRKSSYSLPHRQRTNEAGCELDDFDFPQGRIEIEDLDGAHTGPCIAALRERYLDEKGGSFTAVDKHDYHDLMRSFIETIITLVFEHASCELDEHACEDTDCPTNDVLETLENDLLTPLAIRYLVQRAVAFERIHFQHLDECTNCALAGPDAPALIRARLAREIADDLAVNENSANIIITGAPAQAAFDLVCGFIEVHEVLHDQPIEGQIEWLTRGLVHAISHDDDGRATA
jgi:hypothetical protein